MVSVKSIISSYQNKGSNYWAKLQKDISFSLFKSMVRGVPAYRSFLKQNKINVDKIKKTADLKLIPAINKQNYFHRFPLRLSAYEKMYEKTGLVMTSTSGSTGMPTYFPRNEQIDWYYSVLAEYFLNNGPKGPTLLVDCFGMGVWIGGLITYQAFRYAALRGCAVSIITPGINKKEIFHSLKELAPNFKNVVIAGYPPFVKDILDESRDQKINLNKFNLRLLFAAESFTETFRDYVVKKGGVKNAYFDTLNIYGSAELGAMAFETPLCILIRKLALKNQSLYKNLFDKNRLPTLAQYNPEFVSFEGEDGEILINADNSVPFMRYRIGDNGGVYTLPDIEDKFKTNGVNLRAEAKKLGIPLTTLPFVYVYERSDFSTKLYGAIIYPEHIKQALFHKKIKNHVTGKFNMSTKLDEKQNQFLEINVELKNGKQPSASIKKLSKQAIVEALIKNNAEYKNNHSSIPQKVLPTVILWENGHPTHFQPGIKQRWASKS